MDWQQKLETHLMVDIVLAISVVYVASREEIFDAYGVLGSWDKTIAACKEATNTGKCLEQVVMGKVG